MRSAAAALEASQRDGEEVWVVEIWNGVVGGGELAG